MTRDEWRRAEPILTQALQLSESEQQALVDTAALDAAVRSEIMKLLALSGGTTRASAQARSAGGTGPAVPPAVTLASGAALEGGRFVIVRQIGRGGMGAVYLAQDTSLGTLVALKIVPPDERLIHEAQRAAMCSGHEHVATVYNVLRTDAAGQHIGVLVMEYIPGRPANRILEDGPVGSARALRWMRQAAGAVAHAHDCEVLHCDLKPANIIITPDDRVKVLDFGIARGSFELRQPGEPARGTLPYMSPEQLCAGEFSRASDVYSLGATLFEFLTGRPPFTGDGPMLKLAIVAAPPPRVSQFLPDASARLDAILDRALAKNPEERFRSARAFARALEEVEEQGAGRAVPLAPTPSEGTSRAWPASPWAYVGGATAALAALSVGLGFVACRAFEVILRIDSEFSASPGDYFRVGREALLPFAAIWISVAAGAGLVAGLALLVRWRAAGAWQRWSRWWQRLNPHLIGVAILLAGIGSWLALTWTYRELFVALLALHEDPARAPVGAISLRSRPEHLAYANLSAAMSFLLVLCGAVLLPYLRRRSGDSAALRSLTWATLLLAGVTMVGPTAPRRFLFERFRVVEYAGQTALEIARAGDDLLLYDPRRRVTFEVRRGAPSLLATETTRQIFTDGTQ